LKPYSKMQIEEATVQTLSHGQRQFSRCASETSGRRCDPETKVVQWSNELRIADKTANGIATSAVSQRVVTKFETLHWSDFGLYTPFWSLPRAHRTTKVTTKQRRGVRTFVTNDSNYVLSPSSLLGMFGVSYGLHARIINGWQFSLQPFNAVPAGAPIFEFCRDGNISGIQTLLSGGYASLRDRNPMGQTPLWVLFLYLDHFRSVY